MDTLGTINLSDKIKTYCNEWMSNQSWAFTPKALLDIDGMHYISSQDRFPYQYWQKFPGQYPGHRGL